MENSCFVCSYQLFTFSDWASSDLRLLVTFFNSSSKSPHFLWARRRNKCVFYGRCFILSHLWCSLAYSSETSALSSALSSSPSRTSSLRVTCRKQTKSYIKTGQNQKCWISMEPEGQWLTSSHLRSASSAMFFASLSCNSWISIFSSSFIALFSITFMPLRSREMSTIQQGQQGI